jgi:hypothetical protein
MEQQNLKVNCTELSKTFNLYYHSPENLDFSPESYINLLEFNTIEEFWVLDKFIRKEMVENGMFFVMVNEVLPVWEDIHNIKGGCVSWKVDRKNSYKSWIDCIGHFIMQDLGNITSKVNGVSISPKKNSSIIKLWFKEEINIEDMKLPESFLMVNDKIIYKSHVQNIDKDKSKKAGTYITPNHHVHASHGNMH